MLKHQFIIESYRPIVIVKSPNGKHEEDDIDTAANVRAKLAHAEPKYQVQKGRHLPQFAGWTPEAAQPQDEVVHFAQHQGETEHRLRRANISQLLENQESWLKPCS